MRRLWILALIPLLVAGASAGDEEDKPDARLDQKVTLEVSHAKLEDVANELSERTGVVIKAGSGARDWRVRERRVTVQAKDVRLGTLMDQASELLNFRLTRGGKDGEWTYLYWQDAKSRALEAEMLTAEKEAAAQRVVKLRRGTLDVAAAALGMSPQQALRQRDSNPMLAYLGGTRSGRGWAQILSALPTLFPVEYDLMMRGRGVIIPLSGLPPALRQAAVDAATGGPSVIEGHGRGGLVPHQLVIEPADRGDHDDLPMPGVGATAYITGVEPGSEPADNRRYRGHKISMFPLCAADSGFADLLGRGFLAMEEGMSEQEVEKMFEPEARRLEAEAKAAVQESPTQKNPPTDPELTREVELGELPKTDDAAKVVVEVSKAVGKPILLESFTNMKPLAAFLKPGKQPVYKILIGLEKAGYTWKWDKAALRIRPEDWAQRRSYQIPESFLAHYKQLLEQQGEFTLDDLAAVVTALTNEQIENTLFFDPDLKFLASYRIGRRFAGRRELLRVYGSLSAPQRSAVVGEPGLPFAQLTGTQWDLVNGVITECLGGVYVVGGTMQLHLPSEEQEKAGEYSAILELAVQTSGQEKPQVIYEYVSLWSKARIAAWKEQQAAERAAREKQKVPDGQAPVPAPAPAD